MSAVATAAFRRFVSEAITKQIPAEDTSASLEKATANAIEGALHDPLPGEAASVQVVRETLGLVGDRSKAEQTRDVRAIELAEFKANQRVLEARREAVFDDLLRLKQLPKALRQTKQTEISAKQHELQKLDQDLAASQRDFERFFALREQAQLAFATEQARSELAERQTQILREIAKQAKQGKSSGFVLPEWQVLVREEEARALEGTQAVCLPVCQVELKKQQVEQEKQLRKLASDLTSQFAESQTQQTQQIAKLKRDLEAERVKTEVQSKKAKALERKLQQAQQGPASASPTPLTQRPECPPQVCVPCQCGQIATVAAGAAETGPVPGLVPQAPPVLGAIPPPPSPPLAPPPLAPAPPGAPPIAPPPPPGGFPPSSPKSSSARSTLTQEEELQQKKLKKSTKSPEAAPPTAAPAADPRASLIASIAARAQGLRKPGEARAPLAAVGSEGASNVCLRQLIPPVLQKNQECLAELETLDWGSDPKKCGFPQAPLPMCAACLTKSVTIKGIFKPGSRELRSFLVKIGDAKLSPELAAKVQRAATAWYNEAPSWHDEEAIFIDAVDGQPLPTPIGDAKRHAAAVALQAKATQGLVIQPRDASGKRNEVFDLLSAQEWKSLGQECVLFVDTAKRFQDLDNANAKFGKGNVPVVTFAKKSESANKARCQGFDLFYKWSPVATEPVPLNEPEFARHIEAAKTRYFEGVTQQARQAWNDSRKAQGLEFSGLSAAANQAFSASTELAEVNKASGELKRQFEARSRQEAPLWLTARPGRTLKEFLLSKTEAEAFEKPWIEGKVKVPVDKRGTLTTEAWESAEVRADSASCILPASDRTYLQLREEARASSQKSSFAGEFAKRRQAEPSPPTKATTPTKPTPSPLSGQQQQQQQSMQRPALRPVQTRTTTTTTTRTETQASRVAPVPSPVRERPPECTDDLGRILLTDPNGELVFPEQTPESKLSQAVMKCLKSRGEVEDCRITNSLCVACDQVPIVTRDVEGIVASKDSVRERFSQKTWAQLGPLSKGGQQCTLPNLASLEPQQQNIILEAQARRDCQGLDVLVVLSDRLSFEEKSAWKQERVPFEAGFHVKFEQVASVTSWSDTVLQQWAKNCESEAIQLNRDDFYKAYQAKVRLDKVKKT